MSDPISTLKLLSSISRIISNYPNICLLFRISLPDYEHLPGLAEPYFLDVLFPSTSWQIPAPEVPLCLPLSASFLPEFSIFLYPPAGASHLLITLWHTCKVGNYPVAWSGYDVRRDMVSWMLSDILNPKFLRLCSYPPKLLSSALLLISVMKLTTSISTLNSTLS